MSLAELNFLGVCFGALGAVLVFLGVYITPEKAIDAGGGFLGSLDKQKELEAPPVQNLLKQSKFALWGTFCLLVGFIFQGIAGWPF